jgi:sugar O-acyltransferase (sialic acid O-acetyltransferase NeuD family)
MNSSVVIIGAGGHAVSVTNVALSSGMSIIAYVDDNKTGNEIMGVPIITRQQCINLYPSHKFAIAIGDNAVRERVYLEYKNDLPKAQFPSLIHKSSITGVESSIGDGAVVMPLVNIGPNSRVGDFCILNTSSSIDHDCNMSDFSSLAPRVVCGGKVNIGARSAISIGATVKHGVKVGMDVVIGANSYVNKPFEDNLVAYGSPCKKVRGRKKGDTYLS